MPYSVSEGSRDAFRLLWKSVETEIPDEFLQHVDRVVFRKYSDLGDAICFPCPLREQEAVAALKALEGCAAAAIANIRGFRREREISVTLEHVASLLMSTYITNIDGLDKCSPEAKKRIPGSSYAIPVRSLGRFSLMRMLRYGPEPGSVNPVPSPVSRPLRD